MSDTGKVASLGAVSVLIFRFGGGGAMIYGKDSLKEGILRLFRDFFKLFFQISN